MRTAVETTSSIWSHISKISWDIVWLDIETSLYSVSTLSEWSSANVGYLLTINFLIFFEFKIFEVHTRKTETGQIRVRFYVETAVCNDISVKIGGDTIF